MNSYERFIQKQAGMGTGQLVADIQDQTTPGIALVDDIALGAAAGGVLGGGLGLLSAHATVGDLSSGGKIPLSDLVVFPAAGIAAGGTFGLGMGLHNMAKRFAAKRLAAKKPVSKLNQLRKKLPLIALGLGGAYLGKKVYDKYRRKNE